jgi:hypothetical protein
MQSLEDVLIFKRVLILCVSTYILILFALDAAFTSDSLSRWFLACSLLFVTSLSLWITNRFNEMSEYAILALLLTPTLIIQLLFLALTLSRDKVMKNLAIRTATVNIKAITIYMSGFTTILVSLALFLQISETMRFGAFSNEMQNAFALDREMNVPAIFSSLLLLIAAGLLFEIFRTRFKERAPFTWHWGLLGGVFVFLSFDEMFSIHESLIGPIRRIMKIGGVFSYEWIILAIPLVLILAIAYSRFFFHLPRDLQVLIFLAAGFYIGGSIGGEMMSGWYASKFTEGDANYILLTIFEETLEMSGIIIFIYALLLIIYNDSLRNNAQLQVNSP